MSEKLRVNSSFTTSQKDEFNSVRKTLFWGFWGLVYVILFLLAFFSSDPYLKFSGLGGLLAVSLYLVFFRALLLENNLKKLKKENLKWYILLEGLEEERFYSADGKARVKLASLLIDFFGLLFQTRTLLLFFKDGEEYRLLDSSGKKKGFRKRVLKADDPLVLFLKKQSEIEITDLQVEKEKLFHSNSWLKEKVFESAFTLKSEEELVGFVLFSSEKFKISEEKKKLLFLVSRRIIRIEQFRELKRKFQEKKPESIDKSGQERTPVSLDQAEEKRRIFDLYSLFQAANQIYLSSDQNRLFFNFAQNLQKQLNTKSVLILLPESGGKKLKAKYSKGIDFLQFSELSLEEDDPLYEKFKEKESVFQLYQLLEEYQGNEFLARLTSQGFQICFPLSLPDDQLGLVLIGGRAEGIRYNQEVFLILNFLSNVLNVSLKNITQYKKLEELSYTDSLSGLYNHRYFVKRLSEEIFRAKRYQRKLAFVIFDIDEFKIYNDSFGHQSGDQIIRQLGELILKVVRSIDIVCRYGGDEFCIIMPETGQEECLKFIERLRKSIQHHPFVDEFLQMEHHLTVSAGAAIYPQHARTPEKLIYGADMALLNAKNSGKNKTLVYSGEEVSLKNTVQL
ncbi:MAG: GGDEF domain-containing protein [candidate division Zixibacteria bacterium]|nr:GGDEF domain-containing protein [candidate division Zixibacteria bacterium]